MNDGSRILTEEEMSTSRLLISEAGIEPPLEWSVKDGDEEYAPVTRRGPGKIRYHYNSRHSVHNANSEYHYWMVHDGVMGALMVVREDLPPDCICEHTEYVVGEDEDFDDDLDLGDCRDDCEACGPFDMSDCTHVVMLRPSATFSTVRAWDRSTEIEVDPMTNDSVQTAASMILEDWEDTDFSHIGMWLSLLELYLGVTMNRRTRTDTRSKD